MADRENVKFETLKAETMNFGSRNFIEIAKKKAITSEGENEFISIARGYVMGEQKMYKKNVSVPSTKEMREFIAKNIMEI